jgi:hypothetical protein
MERRTEMEARESSSWTICCTKIYHQPSFDWWQKVWLKNLRSYNLLLAFNCISLQRWIWQIHTFSLYLKFRRFIKYIHALDKCCYLEDFWELWWKTRWKVGSQRDETVFDEQIRKWKGEWVLSSHLGYDY